MRPRAGGRADIIVCTLPRELQSLKRPGEVGRASVESEQSCPFVPSVVGQLHGEKSGLPIMRVVASLLLMAAPAAALSKSIDFYANFPGRLVDFLVGNNSQGWANTTKGLVISEHTRTVYQCCNGFLLGADGMQEYSHGPNNGTDSWGQVRC